MHYAKCNPQSFKDSSSVYPYILGLLKYFGAMVTELVSIIVIIRSNSVDNVLKDFVSLISINQIAEVMSGSV